MNITGAMPVFGNPVCSMLPVGGGAALLGTLNSVDSSVNAVEGGGNVGEGDTYSNSGVKSISAAEYKAKGDKFSELASEWEGKMRYDRAVYCHGRAAHAYLKGGFDLFAAGEFNWQARAHKLMKGGGDPDKIRAVRLKEADALGRAADKAHREEKTNLLERQGVALIEAKRIIAAETVFGKAEEIYKRLKNRQRGLLKIAEMRKTHGSALWDGGEYALAKVAFDMSAGIYLYETGSLLQAAEVHGLIAMMLAGLGLYSAAAGEHYTAELIFKKVGEKLAANEARAEAEDNLQKQSTVDKIKEEGIATIMYWAGMGIRHIGDISRNLVMDAASGNEAALRKLARAIGSPARGGYERVFLGELAKANPHIFDMLREIYPELSQQEATRLIINAKTIVGG